MYHIYEHIYIGTSYQTLTNPNQRCQRTRSPSRARTRFVSSTEHDTSPLLSLTCARGKAVLAAPACGMCMWSWKKEESTTCLGVELVSPGEVGGGGGFG